MSWLEAIILGIVQGLTEFLPISSSAHISIVGQLMGMNDPGAAFTAITQLGTETAVVIYFRKDIVRIILKWIAALQGKVSKKDPDVRLGWMVIAGSFPIVILGLLLESKIESSFRNLWVTVTFLILVGLTMLIMDMDAEEKHDLNSMSWRQAIGYGFAQAGALIPGVSRSGATISAGLAMGFTREAAARYSFLLAIPAVMGSGVYKLKDIAVEANVNWGQVTVATLVAGGVGYGVIHWFLRYVSTNSFKPFVYYRLGLAAVVAILILTGVLVA